MKSDRAKKPTVLTLVLGLFLSLSACSSTENAEQQKQFDRALGELPKESPESLEAEWTLYRAKHPEMNEADARQHFNAIQVMSRKARESYPQKATTAAAWAERRALDQKWLKHNIEDKFVADQIPPEFIQQAIDAYAFDTGHPALVTASHILIKPSNNTTAEQRIEALNSARQRMIEAKAFSNEDLSAEAVRLIRAGFVVDLNVDLTFPRYPIPDFMGESLGYNAMVEPFAEAAFALNEKSPLSGVVETQFGHHIVLFQKRTEEKKPKFEDVKDVIIARILGIGRRTGTLQSLDNLMREAKIEFYNEQFLKDIQATTEPKAP